MKAVQDYPLPMNTKEIKSCLGLVVTISVLFKTSRTFQITTDSNNVVIGGLLSQNGHPIDFHSRTLNSAKKMFQL